MVVVVVVFDARRIAVQVIAKFVEVGFELMQPGNVLTLVASLQVLEKLEGVLLIVNMRAS